MGYEYQNLFTRVQVRGPAYSGVPLARTDEPRGGRASFSHLLGRLGDAQVGPIYLGWTGLMSLICGFIAIEIIGLNMWASVNWDPVQFVRQLPWLALEPPAPHWGLRLPPLALQVQGHRLVARVPVGLSFDDAPARKQAVYLRKQVCAQQLAGNSQHVGALEKSGGQGWHKGWFWDKRTTNLPSFFKERRFSRRENRGGAVVEPKDSAANDGRTSAAERHVAERRECPIPLISQRRVPP